MKDELFDKMKKSWGSQIIARAEVKNFTGGAISPKTLANADYEGNGPEGSFIIGNKTCYPVDSLIDWLKKQVKRSSENEGGMD